MKQDCSEPLSVTGNIMPGELLMVYRDPEGSNIVYHVHIIPKSMSDIELKAIIDTMDRWIEHFKTLEASSEDSN